MSRNAAACFVLLLSFLRRCGKAPSPLGRGVCVDSVAGGYRDAAWSRYDASLLISRTALIGMRRSLFLPVAYASIDCSEELHIIRKRREIKCIDFWAIARLNTFQRIGFGYH